MSLELNKYLKNLDRIEVVMTFACTGKCKHCQNGEPENTKEHINAQAVIKAIRQVNELYKIKTVMTFGGEPLLYPGDVCAIHKAATELGVAKRQIITNGYFSKDKNRIEEVVRGLAESGVNDLLLSVDAFHQETIPLGPVKYFAECVVKAGIPSVITPAWLKSEDDNNAYNVRTRQIIAGFEPYHIPICEGNVIFPSGNALKYLREYFEDDVTEWSLYDEDPEDVRALSFMPDGGVLDGNVYETDIIEIIRAYKP
jgi:hypothetical protein